MDRRPLESAGRTLTVSVHHCLLLGGWGDCGQVAGQQGHCLLVGGWGDCGQVAGQQGHCRTAAPLCLELAALKATQAWEELGGSAQRRGSVTIII